MKSKKEIEKTLKENKGDDFVLPMTWDVMFEQMFISEEAMPLLECIISIFGNVDIKDVKGKVRLLPNELKQTSAKDTRSKSDIIADYFKDEKNIDKYIVEMNSSKKMPWRNVFYAYKVAGGGISINDDKYVKAYDTILIDFNTFADDENDLVEMITMRYKTGKIFDDSTKIFEVNMAKAKDMSYNYVDKKEEQVAIISRMFMTTSSLELDKESDKLMSKKDTEKLVNRAKELSSDDGYIRLFDKEENYKELIRNTELAEAHENGKLEGMKLGSKEAKIDVAKNLIKIGLTNEQIVEVTKISIEEIDKLRKEA